MRYTEPIFQNPRRRPDRIDAVFMLMLCLAFYSAWRMATG